jgi:uncharacterized membrane protein
MAKSRISNAAVAPAPAAPAKPGAALLAAVRADGLRWGSLALAVIGALDSGYLSWVKLAHTPLYCSGSGACEAVNSSIYAEFNGIPIALVGLASYLVIVALLALEGRAGWLQVYGPLAVFGLALTGTLYSAYLTYIELFVLHAVCPYCVVSAVVMTGILILSVVRLARGPAAADA